MLGEGLGGFGGELEGGAEGVEEVAFGGLAGAIGITDANGHFVGELAGFGLGEGGGGGGQGEAFEEDVLVEGGEGGGAAGVEIFGDAADLFAFGVAFCSVGEGGHEADGKDGAGFIEGGGHILIIAGAGI